MYRTIQKLGDGVFGSVVKAYDEKRQEFVAIKTYRENVRDESKLKEIQILKKLDHPNIVKLREVLREKKTLSIVLDYSERNLLQYYSPLKNRALCEEQVQSITYQIADGLNYLHQNGYLHRDLKPENIMIQDNGIIKLIDFGQVTYQNQQHTDYVSTRWYRSPEQLKQQEYNEKIDIWAFGCILAELYLHYPLLEGTSEIDQLYKIEQLQLDAYKNSIPKQVLILIGKMLEINPNKRITSAQILQYPWLAHPSKFLPKELKFQDDDQYLISPAQTPMKKNKQYQDQLFFKNDDELECAYIPSYLTNTQNQQNTLRKRQVKPEPIETFNVVQSTMNTNKSKNYFSKPMQIIIIIIIIDQ